MLSSRDRIVCSVVRVGDDPKDQLDRVQQLGPAEREVQPCAHVEHDDAAVRVTGAWVVERHPKDPTHGLGRNSRAVSTLFGPPKIGFIERVSGYQTRLLR